MKNHVYFALTDQQLYCDGRLSLPNTLSSLVTLNGFLSGTFEECITEFYPKLSQGDSLNICQAEIEYKDLVEGLNSAVHGNTYPNVPVNVVEVYRLSKGVQL